MTDEVRLEVIKKTQDVLGKYFKKPPLTEKLLRKPPFRFLHDIISTIIGQTGFLEGLFTEEELNSDNIKDKEAKLAFLTKLIDVVKLISGANLTVRASKIISGQEPTKTNELLQAIGKALDKKVSSTEAVEHYKKKTLEKKGKAGKSTTKEETRKKPAARQPLQTRQLSEKNKISAEQKKRSSSTGRTSGEAKRINDKTDEKVTRERKEKSSKDVEPADIPIAEPVEEKISASAQRGRSSSSAKRKQNVTSASADAIEPTQHRSSSSRVRHSAQASGSREKVGNLPAELLGEEQDKSLTSNHIKENKENGTLEEEGDKVLQQNIEKNDRSVSEFAGAQVEAIETTVLQQLNTRPKTSLRPPSARPISARPAAPRMRTKAELIVTEEIQTPLGNISVIVESSDLKDDDDAEDMVVMETKGGNGDFLENGDYKIDNQLMQEHGHLVAQILETQRELVNTDNVDVMPKKVDIAWESGSKRDREAAVREIDKLRGTIQTLTRTTNPLGKLLDYVQEDVEMMEKELLDWKSQYRQLSEQLEREQKETQEIIEPMKETLKEIDGNMKTQLDKICQVKSQIMKNDQKIQRLLNGHL
ncbi:PREDICTED: TRAF3-interacting protein 1 [Dinoponera quadriceps]|uniref:TRAF3-interacting protein 1 n=1 Tax=Dinoponera quadriceps TaxID=609295 RepID=A0A6P3YDW2_DINQU|nr:PREDICTED: TRAF3-interacting protein 1 [Dinoponera quadriceps]XP_014488047.1 PREDICTED: TRAF3-interacting protein 1 [Dinoponera quadriceps]